MLSVTPHTKGKFKLENGKGRRGTAANTKANIIIFGRVVLFPVLYSIYF
jgi:hypothetical protein